MSAHIHKTFKIAKNLTRTENIFLYLPIIQFPQDIVGLQEIIWTLKPDLIIETGIARGGSLIFSASILQLIGKGSVLGIDILEASDRGGFAGLKFGAILNENHRIGVSYNSFNTASNVDLNSYGIGYDYLIKTSKKLTPFVGVGLNQVNYKETGAKTLDNNFDSDSLEMDGLVGTVNLGAVFELTNNFELEAGYRMALIKNVDGIIGYSGVPIKFEMDDINMTYFGINYKF